MNILRLKEIEKQVIQLIDQAQQDPQAMASLIELHEHIQGLPRPGKQAMLYARLQCQLGAAFSELPTDQTTNLQRAVTCFEEALRFLSLETTPLDYAEAQNNLGDVYQQLPADQAANLQRAIVCYKEALRFWTPETDLQAYATIHSKLGDVYQLLPHGDQATNLQEAIASYQEALRFWTSESYPRVYAGIQSNLGDIYQQLPTGDGVVHLQQAIICYQEALRFWTPETEPFGYAVTQNNLGSVYGDLRTGDRATHLQQAIVCYQEALRFWTLEVAPFHYAAAQNNLGKTYGDLPTGNRAANLRQAITCYRAALQFWAPETNPFHYAATQNNLGTAYRELPTGDRAAHLQQAITCYQEVLRFWTPETEPFGYAATQNNLGNVHSNLPTGDLAINLQQAITCYQEALRFWTSDAAPLDYATTQNNLGNAHSKLPTGDWAVNLQRAIVCYQEALRFWTPETAPLDYAATQNNLGGVYSNLPTGDRTANLQQAIAYYEAALQFWTPEADPLHHAIAQNNLGAAYSDLLAGNRAANLQQAITCYEATLRFWTPETSALDYAATQNNLGGAYSQLLTGNREAHLQQAIICYKEALRFWTPETDPLHYATAQNNLGEAHRRSRIGDQAANVRQAIICYKEALRFWTPETDPLHYATAQNNLGGAYAQLSTGENTANLSRAIACYEEALRFRTRESVPDDCRKSNHNLANLYFTRKAWSKALEAFQAAIHAGEQLYRADLSTESKATEMTSNAELYRHAAYAAVQCGEKALALQILEQGKTRLLSEALRLRLLHPTNVSDEDWTVYRDAAATVRSLQASNAIHSEERVSPQAYAAHVQAAHAANMALERSIEQVRVHNPDFLRTIDLRSAQALLSDDTACFVLFCITTQGSLGILVTRHAQEVQTIEIPAFTQADLVRLLAQLGDREESSNSWLEAYNRYLVEQTPIAKDEWQETIEKTLDMLGQRLIAPILAVLPESIDHIIFIPSAQLFLLPLHATPLAGKQAERLGDRYQVSYAPSIEVLANTQAKAIPDVPPHLYAVINPTADSRLAFASREGAAIAALFAQATLDEGSAGTKHQVMTRVRGKSYIHFACHGHYDLTTPMLSGLDFADDRLTLAELQEGNTDLSATRLVTLSACETGMSDVIQGSAEEYVGMPAGFMIAGVPCVISSLWTVPDLSTTLMMERFYFNHLKEKMSFPAALQEAQRWVRTLDSEAVMEYAEQWYNQSGRKNATLWRWYHHYRFLAQQQPGLHPFEHPYYWAAFTVSGR